MPIDPSVAVGADLPEQPFTWTADEVLLYHLALGAGADPMAPGELRYATERDLQVLPTFALVAPTFRQFEPPAVSFPGIERLSSSVADMAPRPFSPAQIASNTGQPRPLVQSNSGASAWFAGGPLTNRNEHPD